MLIITPINREKNKISGISLAFVFKKYMDNTKEPGMTRSEKALESFTGHINIEPIAISINHIINIQNFCVLTTLSLTLFINAHKLTTAINAIIIIMVTCSHENARWVV